MLGRIRPATVLALLALFFAMGGSALALTKKAVPQAACAQGAVRGLAEVTGGPQSAANIPDHFTADSAPYLGRHFNCGGKAIRVKRIDRGVFDVLFTGNPGAQSAVASAAGPDPAGATVARQPDGSFQVTIGSHSAAEDESFTIVVF